MEQKMAASAKEVVEQETAVWNVEISRGTHS